MGFGARSCIVFCYMNAVTALFISYLFHIGVSSMAIVCSIHKWDQQEKARACRNAGFLYLLVALAATAREVMNTRRERRLRGDAPQRLVGYGLVRGRVEEAESVPLLDRRAYARGGARRSFASSTTGASTGYGGTYSGE